MNYFSKIALYVFALLTLTSCSYEFPSTPVSTLDKGDFNPEKLSLIGSDFSSGLRDAALYTEGQSSSFSALLANQLSIEDFALFDINSSNGLNIFNYENNPSLAGRYELAFRSDSFPGIIQTALEGSQVTNFDGTLTEVNNLSIPGLKSYQIDDPADLDDNIYFERLSLNPGESLLDLSLQGSPSVIMLEIGLNDIFEYAVNGASGSDAPNPANMNREDLTPTSVFESAIDNAVSRMINESSSDIFLFTIPDPIKMPFFNTLPWYFTESEFSMLAFNHLTFYSNFNIDIQDYNSTVNVGQYRPIIAFDVLGGRPFKSKVIEDEYLIDAMTQGGTVIPKYRQMTSDDLFLYSAEKIHFESMQTTTAFGSTTPIADEYVITKSEIEVINERRAEFNQIIKNHAENNDRVYLIDLEALIERVNKGEVIYDGITLSLGFDYKTIISADGINFNAKGQALVANEIINVINREFNSKIRILDINKFSGNSYTTSAN